jgi:tetratricopeptide (TPR) repeat protein
MRSLPGRSILALILAASLVSSRGSAQAPAPGEAEFARGMQLYRSRDCLSAVAPLEIAARAASRAGALLALGFCYRQLKQFSNATNAYQRYLQLRADDEKHALSLLEQTTEEEREWRRTHPEAEPARAPAAPAPQPVQVAAVPAKPPPATSVPPAALAPAPVKSTEKSGIGWPIWVGAGVVVVAAGVITAVLLSKSGGTEPSGTFNGR